MGNINLNSLNVFEVAGRRLSFTSAAKELNLTQGAVAQQIRKLEEELGAKLFERKPKSLVLTSEGKRFLREVSSSLEKLRVARSEIFEQRNQIIISAPPTFASEWLMPRLEDLQENFSTEEFNVRAETAIINLKQSNVDFSIRLGGKPRSSEFYFKFLHPLVLKAVASESYLRESANISSPVDLEGHKLIQDECYWEDFFNKYQGGKKKKIVHVNSTSLAIKAALSGQGIALVPDLFVNSLIQNGELVCLWEEPISQNKGFYLVWAKDRLSPLKEKILDWFQSHFR